MNGISEIPRPSSIALFVFFWGGGSPGMLGYTPWRGRWLCGLICRNIRKYRSRGWGASPSFLFLRYGSAYASARKIFCAFFCVASSFPQTCPPILNCLPFQIIYCSDTLRCRTSFLIILTLWRMFLCSWPPLLSCLSSITIVPERAEMSSNISTRFFFYHTGKIGGR